MDECIYKTKEEVRNKLLDIIDECSNFKHKRNTEFKFEDLIRDLGIDSLDFVGLQLEIEKAFDLESYTLEKPKLITNFNEIIEKICEIKGIYD